ncbi:MAG: DUF3267 domain-containing protein [Clostridia bacterium]|nr:DUF3267 domain-containing protein [Clostridia bacterium]
MRSTKDLPREYRETAQINLQSNKKELLLVNGGAILIAIVMTAIALIFVPVNSFFDLETPMPTVLRIGAMLVGMIVYLVLHEAVHCIFMRAFCREVKPTFGFTGIYAYAASRAYFCRRDYLTVALSPVVIWGIVLIVLNVLVPRPWFWVVYFVQIINVSGAAGDLYVTARMLRMPSTLLVQDDGVSMRIYLPKKKKTRK